MGKKYIALHIYRCGQVNHEESGLCRAAHVVVIKEAIGDAAFDLDETVCKLNTAIQEVMKATEPAEKTA